MEQKWLDPAGLVVRRQAMTYGADGRVFQRENPVDATKVKEYTRDGLGSLTKTLFEDNPTAGSRTDQGYDAIERQTLLRRYTALGRMTVKEVGGATCLRVPAVAGPDQFLFYDATPAGETCPVAGGCTNPRGRLVLAKYEADCLRQELEHDASDLPVDGGG
ncbi:MAG: hypothetical protein AABZ30_13640, partial [Myxococcota bacterium]